MFTERERERYGRGYSALFYTINQLNIVFSYILRACDSIYNTDK